MINQQPFCRNSAMPFFICVITFLFVTYSYAMNKDEVANYSRKDVIKEFIDISFPDSNESKRYFSGVRSDHLLPSAKYIQLYPWIEEYIYRHDGIPEFETLHRREENAGVALYWPSFGSDDLNVRKLDDDNRIKLETELKQSILDLNKYITIKYHFVSQDADAQAKSNFAKVRIIPVQYSDDPLVPHAWEESCHAKAIHICSIHTAIKFPSIHKYDVDGFFVPESDNALGLTACYIDVGSSTLIQKNQISDCLFKSLGMPGFIRSEKNIDTERRKHALGRVFSCSEIKSGMTKDEVINYLENSKSCFGVDQHN